MAAPMRSASKVPIIVILGATGTGKSKLAMEIASRFGGEIINADSMQVYKGLDIVTNKVSQEERTTCRHHLLDYLNPLHTKYTVQVFLKAARPVIADLQQQQKPPVIVGGTNYYIESLLWNQTLGPEEIAGIGGEKMTTSDNTSLDAAGNTSTGTDASDTSSGESDEDEEFVKEYGHMTTADLHKTLMEIDPESAKTIHPNNRRKIRNALLIYHQHKIPKSKLLEAQHSGPGGDPYSGGLVYPDPCILLIQCDQDVLEKRLDDRVDEMMKLGLLEELMNFHRQYNEERLKSADPGELYEHGIFQSIGFKEFHNYLIMSQEDKDSPEGQAELKTGIERMKIATKQYARKQLKRMKYRFLRRPGPSALPVYGLDSTDPMEWQEKVSTPALAVVEAFIKGVPPDIQPLDYGTVDIYETVYEICDICDGRVFTLKADWEAHIKGRKHLKRLSSIKQREKQKAAQLAKKSNISNDSVSFDCLQSEPPPVS